MHMADALLVPAVGLGMYAASAVPTAVSIKKADLKKETEKLPLVGVMGAFVFATQMINFTIPGTGSSGHLCGGMLLTALLGPYAAFLTMIVVLVTQCLLFADGGILALGANIWNMAFYGCFVGYFFFIKPLWKNGVTRKKIALASILGSMITLQLGAFSVTVETLLSGVTELPFSVFVATMQPIHLAIGFVEGLITTAVLFFVYETKPELLKVENKKDKLTLPQLFIVLGTCALFIGGGLSLAASSYPDGLEWSIQRVTGSEELEAEGSAYDRVEWIQGKTAVLPDYTFQSGEHETVGTSVSGIIGSIIVAVVSIGAVWMITGKKKKERSTSEK